MTGGSCPSVDVRRRAGRSGTLLEVRGVAVLKRERVWIRWQGDCCGFYRCDDRLCVRYHINVA